MRSTLIALAATLLILVVAGAYFGVGWSRMENYCASSPPGAPAYTSVEYSWSWHPIGFRCVYDNGRSEISLWF